MKGLLWLSFWCLFLLGAKEADTPRHPLMIDAQSIDACGRFQNGPPLTPKRRNPLINGLDKPNGETA